jgi:23S rRNA (adenine2503-C2)-methyltransferase
MKSPESHIFEQTPATMEAWADSIGMPRYRGGQILEWVYQKGVIEPAQMSNLSKLDREKLKQSFTFLSGRTVRHMEATDGTQKLLIEWDDVKPGGETIELGSANVAVEGTIGLPVLNGNAAIGDPSRQTECVMIPTDERKTACISSQVGCPVGCRFCASGLTGLDASLNAGRIVEQVWRLGRLKDVPRISNVVFMGMGEPLSNFKAVTSAIRTMCALWGLGISARKVTISTVGLPKFIERLATEFELPVTLALSLHAPNDEIRRKLIPWAEYCTVSELLASCQKWFAKTGREITLEYTLLRGVNDRPEHARELAEIARTIRANINLIRYNEVDGLEFQRPRDEDVRKFQEFLKSKSINTHIRSSRGRDIKAACGQLRHENKNKSSAGAKVGA